MVNGITELALTKVDVLDTFPEVKVAVRYRLDGREIASPPGVNSNFFLEN
jgi:adenylosuccinate synthase